MQRRWRGGDGDSDSLLEYVDQRAAEDAFRDYVNRHRDRITGVASCYLFHTQDAALAADNTTEDEVDIDDSKAFRTLDWERGFGFNFD